MDGFIYTSLPSRVIFGHGTIDQLGEEIEALGMTRALVLTTGAQADTGQELVARLQGNAVGLFFGAAMHTPVSVTDAAMKVYADTGADGVVAIGGGSTIGLGKAVALRTDCPQVVVPTTYAGSEMTAIIGQTEDGVKTTQKTDKVLPETVIYDIDYTLTLPPLMSVTSGMNAIAHAAEALYAENANPVLSLQAEEGIAHLLKALEVIVVSPDDREARSDAAYGAWLCAICLANGGVALHHKICHVLGGSFDLPHAETHTVMLPHALSYNAPATPDANKRLQKATGSDEPAAALFDLAKKAGAATSLQELGMPENGIEKAVEATLANPYWNPRPLERDALTAVMHAAWEGQRPAV